MPAGWKDWVRHTRHTAGAGAALRVAQVQHLAGGPPVQRLLLVSDGREYTSEQQFAPLWRHAGTLRRSLGLVSAHVALDRGAALPAAALRRFDWVGLKLSWRTDPRLAVRTVRHFAGALQGSSTRLLYFDGDDDLCVQWPGVLEQVTAYIKKQVFADPADYARTWIGKSNLTDYVARHHAWSFAADAMAITAPLSAAATARILPGWNIACDDRIARLLAPAAAPPAAGRTIDVLTRCHVGTDTWIHPLREPALAAIARLAPAWQVLAPHVRVSQQQYNRELANARLCISPFGYGELCWRDFEAIASGCLLVKPDTSHLHTFPDLFRPGETCVPVRWDFADLEARCLPYLQDETARQRMVALARQRLLAACSAQSFTARLSRVLDMARQLPPPVAVD